MSAHRPTTPVSPRRRAASALALIGLTCVAFLPALTAGFIWDDDVTVTQNRTLRSVAGLAQIWTAPGATFQYYPLTFTTHWIEYHVWGDRPAPYHAVNVGLHALAALLLWRLLVRLQLPGAWWAAALFAVHPLQVESVAWISERKNVLAAVFAFAALGVLLPALDRPRSAGARLALPRLALGSALCAAALLSKIAAVVVLPAIPLILWWRRGTVTRAQWLALAPLAVVAGALGLVTLRFEQGSVGATAGLLQLGVGERLQLAGVAPWFYLWKLALPLRLSHVYPRFVLAPSDAVRFVPLAFLVGLAAVLWLRRARWGRGPFVTLALFVVALAPTLGFLDVAFWAHAYVADRFAYIASAVIFAALASVLARRCAWAPYAARVAAGAGVLVCGVLAYSRAGDFASNATLWRDTLEKNPAAWVAHVWLGNLAFDAGRTAEALAHYTRAGELAPGSDLPLIGLAHAEERVGRLEDAERHYRAAIALSPGAFVAHNNLANLLAHRGALSESLEQFAAAIALHPDAVDTLANYGNVLQTAGRSDDARRQYERALAIDPDNALAHLGLGALLLHAGRPADAVPHLEQAAAGAPRDADARFNLALAEGQLGRIDAAIAALEATLRLAPARADARTLLASTLLGRGQRARAQQVVDEGQSAGYVAPAELTAALRAAGGGAGDP